MPIVEKDVNDKLKEILWSLLLEKYYDETISFDEKFCLCNKISRIIHDL